MLIHLKHKSIAGRPLIRLYLVLMFLTAVQSLNAKLINLEVNRGSLLGGTGTLITANEILNNGNQEQETIDISTLKIFELFGFKSPEDMAAKLREISQHEGILFVSAGVSEEALDKVAKRFPEFRDEALKFKETLSKKKDPKAAIVESSPATVSGTLASSLAPLNAGISKGLLSLPTVNETNVTVCGEECRYGSGTNQKSLDLSTDETSLATTRDINGITQSDLGSLVTAKNFYSPISTSVPTLVHTDVGSDLSRDPAGYLSNGANSLTVTDNNGNLIFNPGISISSIAENAGISEKVFSVVPEGWFFQKGKEGSGILFRGEMATKYDFKNPGARDNLIQIAITKDLRNDPSYKDTPYGKLPPGVYTVEKCKINCAESNDRYEKFVIALDKFNNDILRGKAKESDLNSFLANNKNLPGMRDAEEGLQRLVDASFSPNKQQFIANVLANNSKNVAVLERASAATKSKNVEAWTFSEHLADVFKHKKYFTYKHNKEYEYLSKRFENVDSQDIVTGKNKDQKDQDVVSTKATTDPNLL